MHSEAKKPSYSARNSG